MRRCAVRRLIVSTAALAVAGTGAATATACSLATVTPEERVASADVALTAKVTQVRQLARSP